MAASKSTPNLHLPIFSDDDKPSWLGDFNGAMEKIDGQFVTDESAFATANATILSLQNAVTALTARVTTLEAKP